MVLKLLDSTLWFKNAFDALHFDNTLVLQFSFGQSASGSNKWLVFWVLESMSDLQLEELP